METIDRAAANKIGAATKKALEEVAAELGINIEYRGGRYDPVAGTYKPRIEFKVAGAARNTFERDCYRIGLRPEHFGKVFRSQGSDYEITGINLRARRYPVIAKQLSSGKSYKFSETAVLNGGVEL